VVHGIRDSVPDFMALEVAFILKRLSGFSSEFARFGSMTRLQEPGEHNSRFVLSWNPHRTLCWQALLLIEHSNRTCVP
jgi:hypothetical protein